MNSKIYHLTSPVPQEQINKLRVGDVVYLTGTVFTARDRAHEKLFEDADAGKKPPFNLAGSTIWHCGPVSRQTANGAWELTAAGPTTSFRLTNETPRLLREFGVKTLIGKGGMGHKAVEAICKEGAVFLSATGGCAGVYARKVKRVINLHWPDIGLAEAVWELEVVDFGACVVAIDCKGNTLYSSVMLEAKSRLPGCYQQLGIRDIEYRYIYWPPALSGTKEVLESLAKTGGGE